MKTLNEFNSFWLDQNRINMTRRSMYTVVEDHGDHTRELGIFRSKRHADLCCGMLKEEV